MAKHVFVITGAAGTGKTTVSNYLQRTFGMPKVITHTTRPPRPGEHNQVDYYFESATSFSHNHYLESVQFDQYRYGSSQEGLDRAWEHADNITIVLDTKGAITYAQKLSEQAVIIFLTVGENDQLAKRILDRDDDLQRQLQRINSDEYSRDQKLPDALKQHAIIVENNVWATTKLQLNKILETFAIQPPKRDE